MTERQKLTNYERNAMGLQVHTFSELLKGGASFDPKGRFIVNAAQEDYARIEALRGTPEGEQIGVHKHKIGDNRNNVKNEYLPGELGSEKFESAPVNWKSDWKQYCVEQNIPYPLDEIDKKDDRFERGIGAIEYMDMLDHFYEELSTTEIELAQNPNLRFGKELSVKRIGKHSGIEPGWTIDSFMADGSILMMRETDEGTLYLPVDAGILSELNPFVPSVNNQNA